MQSVQKELLEELIRHIAGKGTELIVSILEGEKPVNEFKIAERLKLTINQTRNILYKLYNQNIVSFTKKKDKRKGWYIYFWTLNIHKSMERLVAYKRKELQDLEHQISVKENKHFYICASCNVEFNEETAMNHGFICPECGQLLQLELPDKKISELRHKIDKVKMEIEIVQKELDRINLERSKKIEKELKRKKAERERAMKRKKKRTNRAKMKKKRMFKKLIKKIKMKRKRK